MTIENHTPTIVSLFDKAAEEYHMKYKDIQGLCKTFRPFYGVCVSR